MDWCLYSDDKRKEMDRDLKPEYLLDDLRRYQDVFGEEFHGLSLAQDQSSLLLQDSKIRLQLQQNPKVFHLHQI